MEQVKRRTKGLGLVILLMATLIGIKCQEVVLAPNSVLIGDSIDGFRSYMAAAYHLQHDSSYTHFAGMNHPYGDRNDFTDNLPILVNPVKFISNHFVDLTPWMTGIWNYFLLLSILLTGVFLYLIFRQLDLPLWYAVPVAIGVSFFSPQIIRMDVHYGLAHPFLIPMIIYFLLRFEEKPTVWRSIIIAFLLWICKFFHFYLFIIPALIVGFFHAAKMLTNWRMEQLKSSLLHGTIQVLIPLAVIFIGSVLFDPITDRPRWPDGFFAYVAHWQTVFFPRRGALGSLIRQVFPMPYMPNIENTAYIGLVSLIASLLFFLFCWKIFRYRPPVNSIPTKDHKILIALLLSGVGVLGLSLGLPFAFPSMENYLSGTGPFKQFRSVGRFAWGFFYIINIATLYYGFHFAKAIKRKPLSNFLLFAIIVIIGIDGFSSFSKKDWKYLPHPQDRKHYKEQDNPWLKKFDPNEFQAILPVPVYAIGSENIWRLAHKPIMHRSLWASVNTGLPIIGYFMGRTSISQTYHFIEMVSPPYRVPVILADLPNEKDILIFGEKGNIRDVPEDYDHLWKNLAHFYEDGQLILYRLPIQTLRDRVRDAHLAVLKESRDTSLRIQGSFMSTDSVKNFMYKNYNDTPVDYTYDGAGAFEADGFPNQVFFNDQLANGVTCKTYDISFWLRIIPDLTGLLNIYIEEENPVTGERIDAIDFVAGNRIKHIDGDWALIQQSYTLKAADSRLKIATSFYKMHGKYFSWMN